MGCIPLPMENKTVNSFAGFRSMQSKAVFSRYSQRKGRGWERSSRQKNIIFLLKTIFSPRILRDLECVMVYHPTQKIANQFEFRHTRSSVNPRLCQSITRCDRRMKQIKWTIASVGTAGGVWTRTTAGCGMRSRVKTNCEKGWPIECPSMWFSETTPNESFLSHGLHCAV